MKQIMKQLMKISTLLLSVWLLSACSTIESINESMPWHSGNEVESIDFQVSFGKQLKHAVSVDVVFIYDDNLIALLTNASAAQWFMEKEGYKSSYGPNMDIIHREIVPGYSETITDEKLPERHKDAKSVIAFALYPQNPNAKADLTLLATPWLLFDAQQMQVAAAAPTTPGAK